jgi:hypothetical protein
MKNYETKFGNYFKLPNPGLRAYFEHVRHGQPDEYRTPFYKTKSLDQIIDGWMVELESIGDQWPTLLSFEKDLAAKVGPMSIMKPLKERMDDIDSYYESVLLDSTPISPEAIAAVKEEFGSKIGGLRIRSRLHTVENMKLSTNSGSPFFTKRRSVIGDTLPYSFMNADGGSEDKRFTIGIIYPGKHLYKICAVLGWRGQEGGRDEDDVKQRVVWMFPFAVNIEELRLYQPLIEACQKHKLVPAWISMDEVDRRITDMFDTKGVDDPVICTDFSKFDQHFNADMQHAAKSILDALITDQDWKAQWLNFTFPIKYNIPLAYDWDKIREGSHGMGSGSGGTNADETLTHRALQYEAAQAAGQTLNPNSQCLGDDGVLTYPGITVEDVVRSYSAHGQEMNLDKQYVSKQDCVYLRRWHHTDYRIDNVCVGVYSTCRALGRLAEQERFYDSDKWSPQMVALRQLSIIENCKYHPLREKFADYCMKGDKYRLGLDLPGFMDNITTIAQKATSLIPDFLGYTKSMQSEQEGPDTAYGIANWWIVQYLKSKA